MRNDLPVKRIWMIKATSRIPLGALITVRRNAVLRFQDTRQVHQVPCHERDITLCKVILWAVRLDRLRKRYRRAHLDGILSA